MVRGTGSLPIPTKLPFCLLNGKVVDARISSTHQTVGSEFPVLIAVGTEPIRGVIMPFVREAHGNSILAEAPKFLDESVVEFPCPLSREKRNDCGASLDELGPVSPRAVHGISECHPGWIARVPPILGGAHLLERRFM